MKPEQERVRHLLTDTVTLLCKNGLQFQDELKVEGVIGITLDNNEVFVVHINEAFGEGGNPKPPPKILGSGAVDTTSLAELPGLVSAQQPRPRLQQSRGMRGSRGHIRGRPYGATMRRGAFHPRRMAMGRQIVGNSRGRGMSINRQPPVIPPQSPVKQHPPENISNASPPHIVKTEQCDDDVILTDGNALVSNHSVKHEPQSPHNGRHNDSSDHSKTQNSFVNLSLGDITADNLPFFDPMNDNEDNSLEPPAKRLHSETEPNLASPLDSLMSVVSSNSVPPGLTSPQSSNTSSHHMPSSHSVLPQIKQEPSMSFPPSLQPMGGPADWQMNSPQKSPHGMMAGGVSGNSADTCVGIADDISTCVVVRTESRDNSWVCPYCAEESLSKASFHIHLQQAHGVPSHGSGKYDTKPSVVNSHGIKLASSKQQCVCNICQRVFQTHQGLKLHMGSHTGSSRYMCSVCGHGCSSTTQLEGHMNKHRGIKPHKCPICPAAYGYSYALRQHQKANNHYYLN